MDKTSYEIGHEIVRIPAYYCQYNLIELIWAQIKGRIATKNWMFEWKDVWILLKEALYHVSVKDWRRCVDHAEKLQDNLVKNGHRDKILQNFIINLQDDSNSTVINNNEKEDDFF